MHRKITAVAHWTAVALLGSAVCFGASGPPHKSASAPKPPPKAAPARSAAGGGAHRATPGATRPGAGKPGAMANGGRTGNGVARHPDGSMTSRNARGGEMTRGRDGHVAGYRDAHGNEARFGHNGHVREVHGNGMDVRRGPRGMRRTVVERGGERRVAYGHGRGYISRPYSWHGHSYYSRTYYRHGGYYRGYYHPYYYHGVYLHGYMPAYYYPPVYYGWAYNPWPAPVAYAWGWGAAPWYGYYGAYFTPYPVYPSAAYWITDYMISASLSDAYAAGVAAGQAGGAAGARLQSPRGPHLVLASYSPDESAAAGPVMSKAVKDAVSQEISRELAASQKAQDPSDGSTANLSTLLADGQPHVFVVNTGLTVDSAGQDCGITEGDVLSLSTPPAESASNADLQVLASKQGDCATGAQVSVGLDDLQEMHNHLLANIDDAMAQMKDHPGQGGLPAPPAAAVQGTTQAPYAAAAPAADPNGAAELDQQADQGAQLEQQVVADANAPDSSGEAAPAGGAVAAAPPPPARPAGPITIALGQTQAEVIRGKGQPLNIVKFPSRNKIIFIYSDMKIIFVQGKVSDVQ
ncbi:MAG TPA: hypothetical protein VHU89_13405 [Acidobacteriaceae bacterium]|nr:hypothetical protein [Acidobacteriaceae bacterium]